MPAIRPEDELRHEPGADPTWRENWWLCFFDHKARVHGVVYTGVQPGMKSGFAMFAVFRGDETLAIIDQQGIPLSADDLGEQGAGPIRFQCLTPMQRWGIVVNAGSARAELTFTSLHAAYDWDWDGATRSRHYEQPGRVEGVVMLGDTRLEIQGVAQRDRAWGVREPSILRQAWSSRVLFSERDFGHASAITVGPRTFLFGYRVTSAGASLIDRLELDVSYAYPAGPPLSTELMAWSDDQVVADQQVRLVNLIPHSTIARGRETRQFFTFSEFIDLQGRAMGQLDHWWSDRSALQGRIAVEGNQGRWVE